MSSDIRICEKIALSIPEAAAYSNIGQNTLRAMAHNQKYKDIFLRIGKKTLIKRDALEELVSNYDYIDLDAI